MTVPRVPAEAIHLAIPGLSTLEFIDRGSQGDAWRIRRGAASLDEVLKVMVEEDPARVAREIETMRTVNSAHVMKFEDSGSLESDGVVHPYIIGEYVPGRSLVKRLEAGEWPTEPQAIAATIGLLRGLDAMHAREKVHRDIKPGNVALRGDDWNQAVILDLGLVRDLLGDSITAYPGLLGTVQYMAPEQLRRERAVKRSDVFAAGVTLFVLLTRRQPFLDAGERGIPLDVLEDRIERGDRPSWADVQIRPEIAGVLARMLAAAAYERPRADTAAAVLQTILESLRAA